MSMITSGRHQNGPLRITRSKRFASEVLSSLPDGQKGIYGLGRCWQVSPTEIGVVANIRSWGSDVVDLELGNDLLLVDRLNSGAPKAIFALNRTEIQTDPDTGTPQLLSKYPLCGGFVPLGALREDGAPHPHAGTGFGLCSVRGFPLDSKGGVNVRFLGDLKVKTLVMFELQQYRYDGRQFFIESSELVAPCDLLEGCVLINPPIGNGIPDGDDILIGFVCESAGASAGSGENEDRRLSVARWRRIGNQWRLAGMQTVAEEPSVIEPSLVRDGNGDLLYTARDCSQTEKACFTVWRSRDSGSTWQRILKEIGQRAHAPVSLNCALDGTVYLASCPPEENCYHINFRESLNIWPLSPDRSCTLEPTTVRDCPGEFGKPTHNIWRVDHPISTNARLSDGKWHHLLCYRIMEEHGAKPTETTGLYVEEVFTDNLIEVPWTFSADGSR